jgi:photosystem II stability/assembly factor-like uncharacterized protein
MHVNPRRFACSLFTLALVMSHSAAAQTWQRVGGDYVGVVRTDDVILAVGLSGAILRSTDHGATWSIPASGTWDDLRFVGLIDETRGWAWGANSTALMTTDAGRTWSRMTVPDYSSVDALASAGSGSALVVVDSSRVVRTTDAGASWNELDRFPGAQALSVSMVDDRHGAAVASGGSIYVTSNAGGSWSSAFDDARVLLTAIALDSAGRGIACGYAGAVLITSDSGRTWSTRPGPGPGIDGFACAIMGERAVIAGAPAGGNDRGILAGSTDGGDTWSIESPDMRVRGDQILSSVSISAGGREAASGNLGTLLVHEAGARYWTPSASSMVIGQLGSTPILRYAAFASDDTMVISHDIRTTAWLRTTDGGLTWRTHWGSSATDQFAEVAFFDRNDGVAIVNGMRRRTTNAGLTWQQVGFAVEGTPRSVAFLSRSHWLMASDGGVRRSVDSGDTWSISPIEATPLMMFVRKTAAGFAVAAGRTSAGDTMRPRARSLYRSDDGGLSWRTIFARDAAQNFLAADFADDLTGVAVSDSILRTTDGGATWNATPAPGFLTSVRFFNSHDGFILGFDNLILRTTDAGATWTRDSIWAPDPSVQYPAFEDIALSVDRTTLLAIGRGVIARQVLAEPLQPAAVEGLEVLDMTHDGRLALWPVPSNDGMLTIDSRMTGAPTCSLRVFDLIGRLVWRSGVDGDLGARVDLSGLPSGVYRAVLESPSGRLANWIVINRN